MKPFVKSTVALIVLMASAVFMASCASTGGSGGNVKPGVYVGQYDENMTPENSVVIYFAFVGNYESTFKQINPALDVDEQHFDYSIFDLHCWTVFKPCKPGSRYMLTKLRGLTSGGYVRTSWDMDFKPNQQVMVIDVPKEPGVYCYDLIYGETVAYNASVGKPYPVGEPDDKESKYLKRIVKDADSQFKKLYGGTPWYDAYLAKKEAILNDSE